MQANASATEIAFTIIAVIQAVFAVIWACGAWWVRTARPALTQWALWSGLSAITWLVIAARFESMPLIGVLLGVLGATVLQRGIRYFIGREQVLVVHLVLASVVIAASWLDESVRHIHAAINYSTSA